MAGMTLEQVTRLADELSSQEKRALMEHLARQLQQVSGQAGQTTSDPAQGRPQSLRGIWRDRFPEDVDIDGILSEVRHEWEKEWPEIIKRFSEMVGSGLWARPACTASR